VDHAEKLQVETTHLPIYRLHSASIPSYITCDDTLLNTNRRLHCYRHGYCHDRDDEADTHYLGFDISRLADHVLDPLVRPSSAVMVLTAPASSREAVIPEPEPWQIFMECWRPVLPAQSGSDEARRWARPPMKRVYHQRRERCGLSSMRAGADPKNGEEKAIQAVADACHFVYVFLAFEGCIAWNISLECSWNTPRRERPRDSTFPRITLPRVRRLRFDDVLRIAKYETWVV
jgi:hypothetical protein